jgi:hypothetical protein
MDQGKCEAVALYRIRNCVAIWSVVAIRQAKRDNCLADFSLALDVERWTLSV